MNDNIDFEQLGVHAKNALDAHRTLETCDGPTAIKTALNFTIGTRADLARLSGMTAETLRTLERGKRPNAAQRAALSWAVFKRWARY